MDIFCYDRDLSADVIEEGKSSRKVRAYSKELMMVEVFFEKDAVGATHTHPHSQMTYCLEGSFEFCVGERKAVIGVGDTLYMPPNEPHGCRVLTERGRVLDVFTPCREDFLKK